MVPTPDGKVFGFTYRASSGPIPVGQEGTSNLTLAMVLLAPDSDKPEIVKQFPPPREAKYQTPFADANDRWLVWAEGSKGVNLIDWTLYVFDRDAMTHRKVAEAALDASGQPVPTQWVQPKVDHDIIVWSAGTAEPTLGFHIDCYQTPAAGGPAEVLVHECKNPAISWPYVLFNRHIGAEKEQQVELTLMDLRTHNMRSFRGLRNIPYYALHNERVAWVDPDAKRLHLGNLEGMDDLVLADVRGASDYVEFPAISDTFVSWQQNRNSGVYDIKHRARIRLDDPSKDFGLIYINRNTLVWAEAPLQPPALRLRLLNTQG